MNFFFHISETPNCVLSSETKTMTIS